LVEETITLSLFSQKRILEFFMSNGSNGNYIDLMQAVRQRESSGD
jgi:hypothetical protein